MQTPAAPDSVEATLVMKMASEIIDRHHYLNMAHKKSAKSNVSASAVYTDGIGDSKTKFFFAGESRTSQRKKEKFGRT